MQVIIFGGTTESRQLAKTLAEHGNRVTLFVATDYAEKLYPANVEYAITVRRLDETEMIRYLLENKCDVVVDATHPYAEAATRNIDKACRATNTKHLRLARAKSRNYKDVSYVATVADAVKSLRNEKGNIFLAIGSKELQTFTELENFESRCYIRILPMIQSLQKAIDLGFRNSNIICMHGPFDEKTNRAMFEATGTKIIVTKDSGDIGGFDAKISAAAKCGCKVFVIDRPAEETGLTFDEVCVKLGIEKKRNEANTFFPFFFKLKGKRILIVGAGKVATRRAKILRSFGAEITVISPIIATEIMETKGITCINRKYEVGDVANLCTFLAIAATDDRETNASVAREAKENNVPIIIADRRGECDCYFPAIAENETLLAGLVSKTGDHREVADVAEQIRRLFLSNTES